MAKSAARAFLVTILSMASLGASADGPAAEASRVLDDGSFAHYFEAFNAQDEELTRQHVDNASAWAFLKENIPFFSCPDKEIEKTYYFRWWTFRKHIKETPDGMVITEFLPKVPWSGKHNTISCAAGHHFREGRWLHDPRYLDDYARFWFRKGGEPRKYSFWAADALYSYFLVTADPALMTDLYPDLVANFDAWGERLIKQDGEPFLYWQTDGEDGGEMSNGGGGIRPTINSYMYGDAKALAEFAALTGQPDMASRFQTEAERIRTKTLEHLWNPEMKFFQVRPDAAKPFSGVRESYGYAPWYFNLPPEGQGYEDAWRELMEPKGFLAPFGPTTCEQRCPAFKISYEGHECQWNGPSWPYATSVVLTALANVLNDYTQDAVTIKDYFQTLRTYALSHRLTREDGVTVPWIDENLNPFTGEWLARARLKTWQNGHWSDDKGGKERGKDYNHSTFCDLVINGLVGLRPRPDDVLEINPLVPPGTWDYFCLDNVLYHGHLLAIVYDKTGAQFGKGQGLRVYADGREVASAPELGKVTATLPPKEEASGGWRKHPDNPVLGGDLGTCFDIAVLKEEDAASARFRMWFSWRPKDSIALTESEDGVHWNTPLIVLPPNPDTKWEKGVNRPTVLKRDGLYHMWYTGQANDRSWIGYATSNDGRDWKRMSSKPVMSPEQPWEKKALMCPHVLWDGQNSEFRMWYSAGGQYEPDAIGYATSRDGLTWNRYPGNPIFKPDPAIDWEKDRVTACQVVRQGDWYIMFYIGFRDIDHAQIGIARSRNGINDWQRLPANPIIRPGHNKWDADACYKPYAILDGDQWMLWFNGRAGRMEQIGLAVHPGKDLGFP